MPPLLRRARHLQNRAFVGIFCATTNAYCHGIAGRRRCWHLRAKYRSFGAGACLRLVRRIKSDLTLIAVCPECSESERRGAELSLADERHRSVSVRLSWVSIILFELCECITATFWNYKGGSQSAFSAIPEARPAATAALKKSLPQVKLYWGLVIFRSDHFSPNNLDCSTRTAVSGSGFPSFPSAFCIILFFYILLRRILSDNLHCQISKADARGSAFAFPFGSLGRTSHDSTHRRTSPSLWNPSLLQTPLLKG